MGKQRHVFWTCSLRLSEPHPLSGLPNPTQTEGRWTEGPVMVVRYTQLLRHHTYIATLRNVIWAPARTLGSLEILHNEKLKNSL